MLRVGCVSYINALPLHLPFSLGEVKTKARFHFDIPSALNQKVQQGELDLALTSCVEYLDGDYDLLPNFGIVGHHRVLSVNLYTKKPLALLSGARIGLTHHSAASVSLLKTLAQHAWKVTPQYEPLKRELPFTHYDGFLLIGDEALSQPQIKGFQTVDLAAAWSELTGLPFVFALFSVRKESSPTDLHCFQQELGSALRWSEEHLDQIVEEASRRCPVKANLLHDYYSVLKYRLGPQERESLELFKQLRHVPEIRA